MLVVRNLPANPGDIRVVGSIPASGASPGEGSRNPLQYPCLENPVGRGAWQTTLHRSHRVELYWSDLVYTHGSTTKMRQINQHKFAKKDSEVAQPCPTLLTPWTVAHKAPPSMEFSRQEYWSGLPFPPPGDLPNPDLGLPHCSRRFTVWATRGWLR